uniref:Uncharacterized protein n=1 Tax=Neospora caninum (strain Liverpool) TaxID=572307 RepID=A0A0F7UQF3_NEOCL|nr:TPA: hypothetical protein BN1204_060295 [Neospora caninum Liverpool]
MDTSKSGAWNVSRQTGRIRQTAAGGPCGRGEEPMCHCVA